MKIFMNKYVDSYISNINKDIYNELCNNHYLKIKKLNAYVASNATIIPPKNPKKYKNANFSKALFGSGGVLDKDNKYIRDSAQIAKYMNNRVYEISNFNEEYNIIHEKVIYMNFFIKQWGHYLIDVIGRLWYALEDKQTKIVYTCYQDENTKIAGNYLEFIELLGIDRNRLILINKPTRFDEVVIPEMSIYPGNYYTPEYKKMFDIVVENANITGIEKNKKIYCSRMNFGKNNKREFGEEIIEKNLVDNGYKVVYMEKMTLKEQIQILNSAEYIAMTCGSLSHNLLFNRSKNISFIFNKTYRVNLHQFFINEISCSENIFVDVFVSPLPILYGYGPFILRVTKEFEKFARDYKIKITYNLKKVSYLLRMKYYIIYLLSYRYFIIRLKKIRESNMTKYELDYKTIRNYYKEYMKDL